MPNFSSPCLRPPRPAAALLAGWCAVGLMAVRADEAAGAFPRRSLPGADLFTNGAVHQIQITITPPGLAGLRQDARKFVRATVSAAGAVYDDVGIHLKGSVGSFRALDDKPSLTLDFSRFHGAQKFQGLRRVHLNNSVEDPSYLNEILASELFRAAAAPAPRVAHARVVLNGRPLGLYVLKEGFTEDFLACHFQRVGAGLYEPDEGHDVDQLLKRISVQTPEPDRAALQALAEAVLDPDLGRRWQRLQAVLDVDRFLAFMSLEVMLGHRDGYCLARNNFRVYHDLDTGKMVFLPHGMDQLLGIPDLPWKPHVAGLVARAVLDTPEGQQLYRERFVALLHTGFSVQAFTRRVDEVLLGLRPSLLASEFKDIEQQAGLVKERMRARAADLQRQLAQPEAVALQFTEGRARPAGWAPVDEPSSRRMEQTQSPNGRPALCIVAGPATCASWRVKVLLAAGHYRFEGQARVEGVKPLSFGSAQGAGLRVSGHVRQGENLTGDSTWSDLATQFDVGAATEEVELVCELRASGGEAWFDAESLRLVRIQ